MPTKLLHLFLLLLTSSFLLAQPCREVVAFYPSWKWYDRGRLVNPSTIDYSKYTVINYAFFSPEKDGAISLFDPLADKTILLGKINEAAPKAYRKNKKIVSRWHVANTSLVNKAHQNGVKVLISIGGWTMSENFSIIAASEKKRQRFARNCGELIRIYNIDGIDIDWEYPGYKTQKGKAADKENFTLLIADIKRVFDILEKQSGKQLLLTADFGAGASHMANIEWEKVSPLLDHINIMTYDFYGSRPSRTNHHSPLYAPKRGVEGYDLDSSIRRLMATYHVPSYKINIGLAFFGRTQITKGKADIHVASYRKTDTKIFSKDKGTPNYYNISASINKFNYRWDEYAEVPYLKGKKSHTFVTFEDERSIKKKAQYILDNNLAGAIVWDITGDYFENKKHPGTIEKTPLATALKETLCQTEVVAYAERPSAGAALYSLPQYWSPITRKSFVPRMAYQSDIPKKFKRKLKKRRKKKHRRKKKKNRDIAPKRYFDGGW